MPKKTATITVPVAAEPAQPASLQMIVWSRLRPSNLNPRKTYDAGKLEELAASILNKGVLQNLVARPGKGDLLEIAAGERRYRAVTLLIEGGKLEPSYELPVRVQVMSDLELLTLATTENVQRQDMHPLDESEAFVALEDMGMSAEEISLRVGKSKGTILKRLQIGRGLCVTGKVLFAANRVNLEQAQALTLGTTAQQETLLKGVPKQNALSGYSWSADTIRRAFTQGRVNASGAIFKLEQYPAAKITHDLFTDEIWLEDANEFKRLQLEALEVRREKLLKKFAWVDIVKTTGYYHPNWREYREALKTAPNETKGAIFVFDTSSGAVKTFENWTRAPVEKDAITGEDRNKAPEWSRRIIDQAQIVKTHAMQRIVASDERLALLMAVIGLIGHSSVVSIQSAGIHFGNKTVAPSILEKISDVRAKLEAAGVKLKANCSHGAISLEAGYYDADPLGLKVYDALRELSLEELRALHMRLIAARVGSWGNQYGDTPEDSAVAVRIAEDIGVDVAASYTLENDALKAMSRAKLKEIALHFEIAFKAADTNKALIERILALGSKLIGYLPVPFLYNVKTVAPWSAADDADDEDDNDDQNEVE